MVGWDSGSVWYLLTTASLRCAASCYGITYSSLTILRLFLGLLIWPRQLQQDSKKSFSSECTWFACLLFWDKFWQPWDSLCSPNWTGTNTGPDALASLQANGFKQCVLPHPASGSTFWWNSTVSCWAFKSIPSEKWLPPCPSPGCSSVSRLISYSF